MTSTAGIPEFPTSDIFDYTTFHPLSPLGMVSLPTSNLPTF
jgi:hypothetical protein